MEPNRQCILSAQSPALASLGKHHMQFFIFSHNLGQGFRGPPGVMATMGKNFLHGSVQICSAKNFLLKAPSIPLGLWS